MCRAYAIGGDDLCTVPAQYGRRSGRDWSQPADGEVEDYQVDDRLTGSGEWRLRQLRNTVSTGAAEALQCVCCGRRR